MNKRVKIPVTLIVAFAAMSPMTSAVAALSPGSSVVSVQQSSPAAFSSTEMVLSSGISQYPILSDDAGVLDEQARDTILRQMDRIYQNNGGLRVYVNTVSANKTPDIYSYSEDMYQRLKVYNPHVFVLTIVPDYSTGAPLAVAGDPDVLMMFSPTEQATALYSNTTTYITQGQPLLAVTSTLDYLESSYVPSGQYAVDESDPLPTSSTEEPTDTQSFLREIFSLIFNLGVSALLPLGFLTYFLFQARKFFKTHMGNRSPREFLTDSGLTPSQVTYYENTLNRLLGKEETSTAAENISSSSSQQQVHPLGKYMQGQYSPLGEEETDEQRRPVVYREENADILPPVLEDSSRGAYAPISSQAPDIFPAYHEYSDDFTVESSSTSQPSSASQPSQFPEPTVAPVFVESRQTSKPVQKGFFARLREKFAAGKVNTEYLTQLARKVESMRNNGRKDEAYTTAANSAERQTLLTDTFYTRHVVYTPKGSREKTIQFTESDFTQEYLYSYAAQVMDERGVLIGVPPRARDDEPLTSTLQRIDEAAASAPKTELDLPFSAKYALKDVRKLWFALGESQKEEIMHTTSTASRVQAIMSAAASVIESKNNPTGLNEKEVHELLPFVLTFHASNNYYKLTDFKTRYLP